MSRTVHRYELLVEDDNGRYFVVTVQAVDSRDARRRVGYILDEGCAKIVTSALVAS